MNTINTIIFDLGGILIDWNPEYLYKKIFDYEKEMRFFLDNICTKDWNECQDAGYPLEKATNDLINKYPKYQNEINAYYTRWKEMFGNYNAQRRQVISPLYSSVISPICNTYYSAKKNDYYGIIDSVGNEILNFEFDRIIEWNDTLVIAKKNDSFSMINIKNSSTIIEFNRFSFIRENGNKLIEVFSKDGYGIYSSVFGEILMGLSMNAIKSMPDEPFVL